MTKSPIIKFEQVALTFGNKEIFRDFTMEVMSTEKVVVYGKSGMGKSTLLKLILGFVQQDRGKIYFRGKLISAKNIDWLRTQIAYVDQDVVLGEGIVKEVIQEYFNFQANQRLGFQIPRLVQLMAQFELEEQLLEQDVNELSGGERQRMALVLALMLERPLMLLDEVTASLDPVSKKLVINNLVGKKDLTLIVVTHDQEWKKIAQTKLFDFKDKKWKQ